jgi:signal transduction histidine kinase
MKGEPVAHDVVPTMGESSSGSDQSIAKDDWQVIVEAIPDMICVLDGTARIRRVNRSFRERLKLPLEKIIGENCDDLMYAAGFRPIVPLLKKGMGTEKPVQTPDIKIGDSQFSSTVIIVDEQGNDAAGSVRIYHDITDQKKASEQMMQARKMEAIGRLAGEIAHEINNPLLYISNYLYLFSEELPPDFTKREYVEKIQGGVDKLTAFTRDLIDFSHPLSDECLPVDVETVIGSSLELMGARLRDKKIEIVRRFGCGSRLVLGSGEKLRQAFMNVIQNAIDAMERGGSVIISTSCSDHRIAIAFEDTGAGIPDEDLHRIFDPFFTTRKGSSKKGVGLGLAICYNIVHSHRGEITVSSKAGLGTKFTVTLPTASRESS